MPTIYLETIIAAPIETVFDLSRNISVHADADKAHELQAILGVTSGVINLNETVTWEAKHFGFRMSHTSKIIDMNRPHSFADEMLEGMFHHWHHLHKFETLENDKTKMIDLVDYASPLGMLGKIVDRVYLKDYMTKFLIEHNKHIKKVAEYKVGVLEFPIMSPNYYLGIIGVPEKEVKTFLTIGANDYEQLLIKEKLISSDTKDIAGIVSYAKWTSYMFRGMSWSDRKKTICNHDDFLSKLYIASKVVIAGKFALQRGIKNIGEWKLYVLSKLSLQEGMQVWFQLQDLYDFTVKYFNQRIAQDKKKQPKKGNLVMSKKVSLFGLITLALMLLFPPWRYEGRYGHAGYGFLFSPTPRFKLNLSQMKLDRLFYLEYSEYVKIDLTTLLVQCLLVIVIVGGIKYILDKNKS